jgi:electron-transferring-flavoprotein dehydrogenase
MKSGMLAAEAAFAALAASPAGAGAPPPAPVDLSSYEAALRSSWVHDELHAARNIRPAFSLLGGLPGGLAYAAVDTYLLRGRAPWTLRHRRPDHEALRPAAECHPRPYPPPDGRLTFDIPTSLNRSGTSHDHDQPPHLRLRNPKVPAAVNLPIYGGPEARYCPAGVYEYVEEGGEGGAGGAQGARLQINAQNCVHCKACDIKDPGQNIQWTPPEGGGGPQYSVM